MAYLEWNTAFETGIPGIDYEHRKLVGMLNDLHALITARATMQDIGDLLAEFHTLANAHFALEEKIMKDESYAGLTERRSIHRQLLDQVREIIDAVEAGDCPLDESLPAILREWLLQAMSDDVELLVAIGERGLRRWGLERN